jgi:YD repeat-containing protein
MDDGYLLTKVHHPSGFESQYGYRWYEPKADVTAFTDQLNPEENKSYSYYIVTQKTHDAVGQIPRTWKYEYTRGSTYYQYVDEPTGVSKRWQFKSHRITDPQGLVTEQDFVIGQLERLRTPQIAQGTPYVTEHLILNLYDMKTGLLVSQNILKGPNAHVTNYEYDEYSQPIKIIDYGMYNNDKDTRVTRIVYDLNEELITKNIYGKVKEQWIEEGPTDPDKTYAVSFNAGVKYARVQNTYSALGDLIQVKKYKNDSEYVENRFEYDVYGNVVKQWDELNSLTEMMYQSGAYPIQTTKYVGGKPITTRSTVSAYTGVPLSQTNEIGYTVAYDYDVLGRKTKETHPDGSFEKIDYLDTLNQTHVIDRKGRKTQYVYTGFGELSTITDPLNQTTKFETNTLGKLWKITLTDGRQYEYTYDEIYRPIKVTYPDGTFAKKAYEDAQNKILVWDENGHGMEYAYDAFGNLERVIRGSVIVESSPKPV